jgi:peptidoglycan/LPS O-acetylase OafA/YrhL
LTTTPCATTNVVEKVLGAEILMQYRVEIDGLRAVAVIPVILFHAGFKTFSGGYIGVDVFFVISGYLITSIILNEKEAGIFSLAGFYERRARRILPPMFLVMFVSMFLAWKVLLPSDMEEFSLSLVATSMFGSNFFFWYQSSYFDTATELKPLLHTWSLAVEEQYYVLFPIFILLTWRLKNWLILSFLWLVALLSLAAAVWGSINAPLATFFLFPTRGWELLMGVFCAFHLFDKGEIKGNQVLSLFGAFLIFCSVILFDSRTRHPGFPTLLPTLGATLVILYTSDRTLLYRVLANRVLVGIGLISYSYYLWHQPLFAFARHQYAGSLGPSIMVLMIMVSLAAAYLSWRFVEKPFRDRSKISRRKIVAYGAFFTTIFVTVGLGGHYSSGYSFRFLKPPNIKYETLGSKISQEGDICEQLPLSNYEGVKGCAFGDKTSGKIVVLYGDSHGRAISEELDKSFKRNGFRGVKLNLTNCNLVNQIFFSAPQCDASMKNMLLFIKSNKAIPIIIGRWSYIIFPLIDVRDMLRSDYEPGIVEREQNYEYEGFGMSDDVFFSPSEKTKIIEKFIMRFSKVSKPILVYPIPEIGWDIARLNYKHYNRFNDELDEISIPKEIYLERNRLILDVFGEISSINGIADVVRSDIVFCDQIVPGKCMAQFKTVPLYYDDNHLSNEGARLLVVEIQKHLNSRVSQSENLK